MTELFCALIGAIAGFAGAFVTLKVGYRQVYAKTVSESRNKWLTDLRDLTGQLLAEAKCINGSNSCTNKFHECKYKIFLWLNVNEPLHATLKLLIDELELAIDSGISKSVDVTSNKILVTMALILKPEWEKVKSEAGGKK